MLIFHEGLPGSGKSYEAVVNRIIKALEKKRKVFAFISGINFDKFSEITGIPLDTLRGVVTKTPINQIESKNHSYTISEGNQLYSIEYTGLLFQIESDQVLTIHEHVADDSLVLLDELQDYFPSGQRKLEEGITTFVTQHRHRGIDVIAMGQDHRDCHNLWKRRIDQLIHFTKRDAIGRPNDYTWTTYKQKQGKFEKLRSGKGSYDSKYFGLYLSHVEGAENTETYEDDRSNVFKSSLFRFYLPGFALLCVFSVWYLVSIFTGDTQMVNTQVYDSSKLKSKQKILIPVRSAPVPIVQAPVVPEEPELTPLERVDDKYSEKNYIVRLLDKYKPRLSALIEDDTRMMAHVEFLDSTFHVHEQLNLKQLSALGWDATRTPYGIKLTQLDYSVAVTEWPLDTFGKVSQHTSNSLR
jgi:zona occludens toxin